MSKNLKVKLTVDADGNIKGVLANANKQLDKFESKSHEADNAINELTQTVRKFGVVAVGAFAVTQLKQYAREIISVADGYKSMRGQIDLVAEGHRELLVVQTALHGVAIETRGDISDLTKLYSALSPTFKAMGKDIQDSINLIEIYNKSLALTSPDLQQSSAATLQFSQAMGSGVMRGDEFNSMMENGRGVMMMLADGIGVPIGALRAMAEEGELTAEVVVAALEKQAAVIDEKFTKIPLTVGAAMNVASTEFMLFIGQADESTKATETLAEGIVFLSQNLDEMVYLIKVGLVGAITAKAIPALYGMATATTVATAANVGLIATTKAATVAALAFALTPIGAAMTLVAGGAAYLALKQDEAKNATDELTESAGKLGLELSKGEVKVRAQELVSYRKELDYLIKKKKQNASVDVLGIKQSDLESRIEELSTFKDLLAETLTLARGDVGLDLAGEYAENNKTMLEERLKLEETLFNLTATTEEKREKELSLLDAENQYIQKSIWAIQDKAIAQKEYNELLVEQNKSMDISLDKAIAAQDALSQAWGQKQNDAYNQRTTNQWDDDTAEFDAGEEQDALLSQTLALANGADLVGDAWVRTGNKALDALGSMSAMMQDLSQSDKQYADQQATINKTQWEDEEDKYSALTALDKARTKNSIKGSMAMLDASVAMFEEGSDAQELAHKLSLSMTAIELGMELQKQIAAMTTASTVNAANTSTALTGATASVASAGTGDPYTAPFRVAAMSVMMAGVLSQIGVSFGGSSAGASNVASLPQPDGSVLGSSDPSQSVSNVYDLMVDIEADQYIELRSINREMQSLNSNLTGFVSSLYRTGGLSGLADGYTASTVSNVPFNDLIEMTQGWSESIPILGGIFGAANGLLSNAASSIFGSTSRSVSDYGLSVGSFALGDDLDLRSYQTIKKKTDGGWFGSSRTSYATSYADIDGESERLLNGVFDSLAEGMIGFGDVLDRNVSDQVMAFEVSIGNISTSGQTSAQIQESLNNAISAESDRLAYAIFPDLVDAYAKLNEGAFETLGRLSVEQAVVSDVVGMTNQRMSADAIALSQSLISIAGGLDALTTSAANYYDAFFTESEKSLRNQQFLTDALVSQNLVLPETREAYRSLVEGLDLSTDAAQEQYVALMDLSEKAADYYDALEESQMDALRSQIDLAQASINEYQQLSNALQSAYDAINVSSVDSMSYMSAQSELFGALTLAQNGELPSLNSIEDSLNVVAQNNVENYASLVDFERDQAITSNLISELMGYTDSALDVEDQMLIELQRQTDLLSGLNIVSAETDGSHKDGLYSVPFDGYTATLHQGEAVVDARTMSGLRQYGINTSNGSNGALIAEIKALKSEVSAMREQSYQVNLAVAVSTGKTSRVLDQWNEEGMPVVRDEVNYASN